MAFTARRIRVAARIVAAASLFVGLSNAFLALGVSSDVTDPVTGFGQFAFVALTIIALLRLFAAVGLWAYATWGAFLLLFASLIEIGMVVVSTARVAVSPIDFGIAIMLLASAIGLLIWRFINSRVQLKRL